jgi:multiple sugar transport system ATP-binding protein
MRVALGGKPRISGAARPHRALPLARWQAVAAVRPAPEHIMEQRSSLEALQHPFEVELEVTEPMGMETIVHFRLDDTEVCGRVNPYSGAEGGQSG